MTLRDKQPIESINPPGRARLAHCITKLKTIKRETYRKRPELAAKDLAAAGDFRRAARRRSSEATFLGGNIDFI
jgi:hypothetical protein